MIDFAGMLLILSVLLQGGAAFLALRVNWVYGWRGAWTVISAAIALMTLRRAMTLYRVFVVGESESELLEDTFDTASACVSLLISLLILSGVTMIAPIFRKLARAETVIRAERDTYRHIVDENTSELRIARRMQRTFLPKGPLVTPNVEAAGALFPATETAGDYFDYFQTPGGGLFAVIADVSGHGLGPALVMAETRAWVRVISEGEADPGRLLDRLNARLVGEDNGYFVSMFIAAISGDARSVVYASAGHPGFLLQDANVVPLHSDSLPLGIDAHASHSSSKTIEVRGGDRLLMMTDGVMEAESPSGEPFGIERALAVVGRCGEASAAALVDKLHEQVRDFSCAPRRDDTTVVVVKFC